MSALPRGELFLYRDFLDRFFDGDYRRQLAAAASALGLSVVGVDLAEPAFSAPSPASAEDFEGRFLVGFIDGPVSRVIGRRRFFEGLLALEKEPAVFARAARECLEAVEAWAGRAGQFGLGGLAVADDIAGKGGLFFSPARFEAVLPVYGRCAGIVKGEGLRAFFHCDGDTRAIMGRLIEAGFDVIHPVDAQAGLDLYDLREELGPRVSFMGHVDIMAWTEERVRAEVERAEGAFSEGGLIIGSSCGISASTISGSFRALYPAFRGERE